MGTEPDTFFDLQVLDQALTLNLADCFLSRFPALGASQTENQLKSSFELLEFDVGILHIIYFFG